MKAHNFGPHVKLGLFSSEMLAISKTRPTEKMKKIKVVEKH
jgi:hypothetical protein